ncbi:hypothetical protein Tco_1395004 [Tanacetum coccineum]
MSANDDFSLHDDEELSLHDDASLAGSVPASNKGDAPAKPPQIITTNTLSNIKLPVLQKDDYDTWAMEMEHYLEYIDNEVWKVIQNGNSKKRVTKGKDGVYRILPPTTQAEQVADEKERKARTLLLMAVPKDHLRRFHGMDDAKEIWAAIKTRFGGNANSKKMQKAVLKQQFEAFTISSKESLEKGYDRFQKLLSQLDALGASVSDEDANHKFLRSLPPAWDSLAMTMRTKKNIDTLSIDDLYNNLSVFEQDIQKTSSSSLTSDNVAFLSQAKASSSKHKPSHNSGSYSSYTTSSSKATPTATPGLADEVIHSFLATNADDVDLIHEDLDQIDDLDLEEMDINWQIAMTAIKIKKFYKKTDFARECKFKGTKDEQAGSREKNKETNAGYNDIPLYSRFKQVEYKGVPHPLSGDYTPREQEDIDDSLYEYGKHGPQPKSPSPTESNASSTVYSSCQSNDSDGEQGTVSDHSVHDDPTNTPSIEQVTIVTQKTQPQVPEPLQTVDPSCAQHVKTPRQPIKTPVTPSPIPSYNRQNWNQRMERELGAGSSFERKPCFVCGSLSHLIKDCDYYEKKMAREAALKSKRVVHTDVRQATPAWNNTNRVNKANQFNPRPVNVRPNLSTASNTIKTGRVLLGVEKSEARSTWGWKRKCQVSLANWMQFGFFGRLQLLETLDPDGTQQLNATIDTIEYTITEESIRRQLQLADASGIHMLQNEEIFAGLQNIGSKSGGWDQFGSNIAIALICLSTGRDFNFSKLIFDGMISNLKIYTIIPHKKHHVQIPQPPPNATHSVQPPPQPSIVQPTAITPPTQPVQTTTSPPPVSSIPDIQPTQPPSPQIPSPFIFMITEEVSNLGTDGYCPRLEFKSKSLDKGTECNTKQTLWTAILTADREVKSARNKLKKKRKSDTFVTPEKSKGSGEAQEEQISPSTLEAAQILTIVASEGFKGSQAPLGSKIYKRKSKTTKTPTKILHFEEPDSAQVNTAQVNTAQVNTAQVNTAELNPDSTPSAQVNTGEINAAEVNTGEAERVQRRKGKEPMTEEDLQAEVQASKTSKELQELADLEEAKRVQAEMDVETQRQIDLDALLARRLVEQEEEAAREALATEFDYIQARLNADQILAEKIQQEEREQYSIEERAKFLHDTIAAQRKFLAEQRSAIIRNKPPTVSQLRNQMITYLKHVANKKHAELKSKSFEEIQVLYERYKKQDQTFVAIGSEEDERAIKKINEKDADKEEEKKDESAHEEVQEEEGAKKGVRHIEEVKSKRRKHGSFQVEEYKDRLPEGFDRMLWGDMMIMFNQGDTADFWDTQQDWKLISWKLHSSSGVHTIMTSTGLVFHMLVESRYPLTKEVLSQMLELKLETEEESSMALELIKFVKQQLEEFEDSNDDDTVTSTHEDEERV